MDLEVKVRDEVRIRLEGGGKQPEVKENQVRQKGIAESEFKQFDTIDDSFFTKYHYYYRRHKNFSLQTIERISRECDILKGGLPDSIFVRANKQKPDLLRAVIVGPKGTPHHDGLFFFDVYFPSEFPKVPPIIRSLHIGGLRDFYIPQPCNSWSSSTSTLLESLLSIHRSQILRGEVIYISEMATLTDKEMVYMYNWRTMVYVLAKPPKYFENFVAGHFHDRAEKILTTCKAYISERVNTVDNPVIRQAWREEFDMMEDHYNKLVDAFQKNGSILPELSNLDIEFHGERSCSKGLEFFGWATLCVLIIGFFVFCYFAVKDVVSRWWHL